MRSLAALLLAVPFVAGFSCDFDIDDGDGQCPDREALCPNLSCEDGFAVDEDGCELCEAARFTLDDAICLRAERFRMSADGPQCRDPHAREV